MIPKVWVSFAELPKKHFIGCRYLDIKEKKIFEHNGKEWNSVDVIGQFGIILIMNPPKAYYVDGTEIKLCKKKDLKRFGI